jgi:hypothetical protein
MRSSQRLRLCRWNRDERSEPKACPLQAVEWSEGFSNRGAEVVALIGGGAKFNRAKPDSENGSLRCAHTGNSRSAGTLERIGRPELNAAFVDQVRGRPLKPSLPVTQLRPLPVRHVPRLAILHRWGYDSSRQKIQLNVSKRLSGFERFLHQLISMFDNRDLIRVEVGSSCQDCPPPCARLN